MDIRVIKLDNGQNRVCINDSCIGDAQSKEAAERKAEYLKHASGEDKYKDEPKKH